MRSVPHVVGWVVFVVGWLLAFVGTLWIIASAWQRSVLWGVICILVPVIQLVYVVAYWKEAKEGFFLQLAGLSFILLAAIAGVPPR